MRRALENREAPNADLPVVQTGSEEHAKYAEKEKNANQLKFADLRLHLDRVSQ